MAFEICWEERGAYKRFHGHVTGKDLMDSVLDIEGDPRFDALRYVINDFLEVESVSVPPEIIQTISAIDSAAALSNPNVLIAIVAVDAQIQSLAEIYVASPMTVYPTEVFDDVSSAREWLAEREAVVVHLESRRSRLPC